MSKQEACDQYDKYAHDPLLISDMYTQDFEDNCWCRDCLEVHEETHMDQDWIVESLQPEVDSFTGWCSNHGIDIVCYVATSTDCATVLTGEEAAYETQWTARVAAAISSYEDDPDPEGDADAAALDCYQGIIDDLKILCEM